jgi:DNA polymerase V
MNLRTYGGTITSSKKLIATLDSINERFGSGTLQYASSIIAKEWKASFNRRSPAFTTSWDELPVAH